MTAPTPTPDPLARFRELLDAFEKATAWATTERNNSLVTPMRVAMWSKPVDAARAALLAEAERLVAERNARPNCKPEYIESLRAQAERERASAQHRLLVNAELQRRIHKLENALDRALRPATETADNVRTEP